MKKNCHIVNHKPSSCPFCKGRIVTITYGSVPPEIVQEAIEGKLILGGRFVSPDKSPEWACIDCGTRFLEDHTKSSKVKVVHPLQRFYRSVLKIIGALVITCIIISIIRRFFV
ncbi:hypothetical protein MC916_003587 [Elizabethkingia anophelis]|uniref:hypothetical protein n=1 Tax=Elizabethkingia anophelis TaxID=1117645 RepID=UPI001D92B3F5|nr:hypothetical protein [Elizabethkingia anophelis]EHM7982499.1 hypothetical protein [Elizabethkingia anophelis]EHM8033682.1 hypothetical protein [Elizabethkingia anophelis]EHZ9536356.1 hypothetical protein [Elizabethkingia anophelis]EKU3674266.1 hypothetical protein [Elizabethkingia anophelis]EKU4211243.1 hypothetical protein [Elizabethkingia anophelis]